MICLRCVIIQTRFLRDMFFISLSSSFVPITTLFFRLKKRVVNLLKTLRSFFGYKISFLFVSSPFSLRLKQFDL